MLDKSTLSIGVVGRAIADTRESGKEGGLGGRTMPDGDIAVFPMLLDQLPGGTSCSCKTSFFRSHRFLPGFAFLEDEHCHICASPILHVFVPIRGVHVIRAEVQTCSPHVPTLLGWRILHFCAGGSFTSVGGELFRTSRSRSGLKYLHRSVFWLEENAAYHFSNLVT